MSEITNDYANLDFDGGYHEINAGGSNSFNLQLPDDVAGIELCSGIIYLFKGPGKYVSFKFKGGTYPDKVNGEAIDNNGMQLRTSNLLFNYIHDRYIGEDSKVHLIPSFVIDPALVIPTPLEMSYRCSFHFLIGGQPYIHWEDVYELDKDLAGSPYQDALDFLESTQEGQTLFAKLQNKYAEKIVIEEGNAHNSGMEADPDNHRIIIGAINDTVVFQDINSKTTVRASEVRLLYHESLHLADPNSTRHDLHPDNAVIMTDDFLSNNCSNPTKRGSYDNDIRGTGSNGLDDNPMQCGEMQFSVVEPSESGLLSSPLQDVPVVQRTFLSPIGRT
ncbi:MAG: hypothetical protein KDD04_06910 [Sinomicrobium sp.]|nr:hypothetical protein [Sinomicrobium sp.]